MFTVLEPGQLTSVQDQGRRGFRAYGVTTSGAMDRFALTIANLLAGNPSTSAALEMTLRGPRLRFARPAFAAISGADMQVRLNGQPVANWSSFAIPAGAELAFEHATSGCRAYLALHGGIPVPLVMGSRSTDLRAQIGGLDGRMLRAGDELPVPDAPLPKLALALPPEMLPRYASPGTLRVMMGPQEELFTAAGIATFLGQPYAVTHRNDRMGYVLEGPKIAHSGAPDIVSDALCPGSVQVPGSGLPIVMGSDCQTTGGYAKIATVIGPDLMRLAQSKAGDVIRFAACTDAEAVQALREERALYQHIESAVHQLRG
jgi:biotin-dependent carboxylase-like uncharacterized protein